MEKRKRLGNSPKSLLISVPFPTPEGPHTTNGGIRIMVNLVGGRPLLVIDSGTDIEGEVFTRSTSFRRARDLYALLTGETS